MDYLTESNNDNFIKSINSLTSKSKNDLIQYVTWNISNKFYKSYLLQKLKLPSKRIDQNVFLIILDNNQYSKEFSFGSSLFSRLLGKTLEAGSFGNILLDQYKEVQSIIQSSNTNDMFILGGHHNFEQLSNPTIQYLKSLFEQSNVINLYISSHTHTGGWNLYNIDGLKIYELNIGSLNDWPIQYRMLKVGEAPENIVIESIPFLVDEDYVLKEWGLDCSVLNNDNIELLGYVNEQIENDKLHLWRSQYTTIKAEIALILDSMNNNYLSIKYPINTSMYGTVKNPDHLKSILEENLVCKFGENCHQSMVRIIEEILKKCEHRFNLYEICRAIQASKIDFNRLNGKVSNTLFYEKIQIIEP